MITFVIPTINQAPLLVKALASIRVHAPGSKVILINNGNDLDVFSLVTEEAAAGAVVYHFPKNAGVARSWNVGIHTAYKKMRSDYVVVMNDDAELRESIDKATRVVRDKSAALVKVSGDMHDGFACFLVARKAIEVIGYFDEGYWPAYYEDLDYEWRLRLAGMLVTSARCRLRHMRCSSGGGPVTGEFGRALTHHVSKWGPPGSEYRTPYNKGVPDLFIPFNEQA